MIKMKTATLLFLYIKQIHSFLPHQYNVYDDCIEMKPKIRTENELFELFGFDSNYEDGYYTDNEAQSLEDMDDVEKECILYEKRNIDLFYNYCLLKKIEKGYIPNGIKYLFFGHRFNQPLQEGNIPESTIYVEFGDRFCQHIKKGDIPNSVKYLLLNDKYPYRLKRDLLPEDLQILFLHTSQMGIYENNEEWDSVDIFYYERGQHIGERGKQIYISENKIILNCYFLAKVMIKIFDFIKIRNEMKKNVYMELLERVLHPNSFI
jgi:hypothetical protein